MSKVLTVLARCAALGSFALPLTLTLAQSAAPTLAIPAGQVVVNPPADALPDPADLVPWPEKPYPQFAPDSVVNTGAWLLDAPAGKHGHLRARPDGQLEFADGTPVRFWGTTTVYGMTFPDKTEEIAQLADAIAASGYNLVRLHHNDTPSQGLGIYQQNPPSNHLLDPGMMDRLDRFVAELYKRGIYFYLDLVDSRPVLEEDGLDDWQNLKKINGAGWKGLFPHPKVVDAWKRAVNELLRHKNPYTGNTWAQEPALATIEIINENGPFWDWNWKLNDEMMKWHDQQWNKWLLARYGTRQKLDAQWTDATGRKGLFDGEDPAQGNVFAPRMGAFLEWDRPYRSKTRGAARLNDYYAYLADTAQRFYSDAASHIRKEGFKGIVIGSHELQGPIDQYFQVQGTGAIAAHLYASGRTAWGARPGVRGAVIEGVDVKTNNWFSNLPRIKVQGAPGINGEWTGGTLTRRADVNVAVAAMTAFQRVTQSLHFSYAHRWTRVPMPGYDITHDYKAHLNAFAMTYSSVHDAPWMTVNRIAAALFVRQDFSRANTRVHLAFSAEDRHEQNLHALGLSGGDGTMGGAALFLPLLHEVECAFFDQAYQGDADVVFMTGRTASGDYSKAKHAVLIGDNPWVDRYHKTRDIGLPARSVHPAARVVSLASPVVFTVTWPYNQPRTLSFDSYEGAIEIASIPDRAQPIGVSADGKHTLGWLDDRFLVLPNGRAFDSRIADVRWLFRLYLAACQRWKIATAGNSPDSTLYYTDTGELAVDWGTGALLLDTPRTQGFSGFIGWRDQNKSSNLSARVDLPYANILITSTDARPVRESRRMLLVAAGRVQNTGQELGRDKQGFVNFVKTGKSPILAEALRGQVTITSSLAADLAVWALDSEGRRLGKVPASADGQRLTFALSPKWGTIWFEIAAPDVPGPAAPPASWPLEEKPRAALASAPTALSLTDYLAQAGSKAQATAAAPTLSDENKLRFVGRSFIQDGKCLGYANIKLEAVPDATHSQVLRAQFGKITKDWMGGLWTNLASPTGVKPEDCLGFGITFKGDGTAPRECYITLKTAAGASYRSKNLRALFENDAWQEVLLPADSFALDPTFVKKSPDLAAKLSPTPDWQTITRVDMNCVGPLMDQLSVAHIAAFYFALKKPAATLQQSADTFHAQLPTLAAPTSAKLQIPWVDAPIQADGAFDEPVWRKSLALPMDEDRVPDWHFFGSHVVDGKRLNSEGANFWLLATPAGLAIAAEVHKGLPDVVAEKSDWWFCDCVEVFTDVANTGGKPTRQLFLAYKRANLDRPAASDPLIQVGRLKLQQGYVLETLIPWKAMGFDAPPTGEFGLEFQVDFASRGAGRALQMTYGTGTNEAWVKADKFLKVSLAR